MDARIYDLARHYGHFNQALKAQEECSEVISAISDVLRMRNDPNHALMEADRVYEHLAEEISDARIMLDQIEHLFGLRDRCDYWRCFKLDRQMKRMNDEEKKNDLAAS